MRMRRFKKWSQHAFDTEIMTIIVKWLRELEFLLCRCLLKKKGELGTRESKMFIISVTFDLFEQ